jgi:carboxyl-terminal processing protease
MSSTPKPETPEAAEPSAAEPPTADERVELATAANSGRPHRRTVVPSRIGMILVVIFASSALFVGGYSLGAHVATTPGTPADEETRFAAFWDVYQLIQSDYAGDNKPTQDQLVEAAINGMLESLKDPYSVYQAPSDFQNSLLSVGGQAIGVGVVIKLQPVDPNSGISCQAIGNGCELAIDQPIPGSPAALAGIQPADVIASVDGTSLDGKTVDQAIALIKGAAGTPVRLGILRGTVTLEISIVRNVYSIPEVTTRSLANGKVAYVQISGVNQPASSQFDSALATALAAGQQNLVLDLRGNLGGYVDDAVKIASEFIGDGAICYQQDANKNISEIAARPGGRATSSSFHVVVLVDGNTASAAEILAGALQARGRAKLIGTKTYGKGIVQEWLPLPDNMGGVHLTVAKWLLPDKNKTWIGNGQNGTGLQPDIPINSANARAGTDPVLDAGLAALGFTPTETPSASSSPAPSASSSTTPAPAPSATP